MQQMPVPFPALGKAGVGVSGINIAVAAGIPSFSATLKKASQLLLYMIASAPETARKVSVPSPSKKACLWCVSEACLMSILSMFPDPIAVATSSFLSNDL